MWKASMCFLKRLWFIHADLLIIRRNILVRYWQVTRRLSRSSFNSKQGLDNPFAIMSILPIRPNQYPIQRVPKRWNPNTMKLIHLHAGPRSRMCGALPPSWFQHVLTARFLLSGTSLNINGTNIKISRQSTPGKITVLNITSFQDPFYTWNWTTVEHNVLSPGFIAHLHTPAVTEYHMWNFASLKSSHIICVLSAVLSFLLFNHTRIFQYISDFKIWFDGLNQYNVTFSVNTK
jgi:hypothetical protein